MHPFKRERLEAAYRYIETLSPEMIAFEFLRRNENYRGDYAAAEREGQDPSAATPSPDRGRRWGLRFPGRSGQDRPGSLCLLAGRLAGPPCPHGARI
jgi:Family of unknown function (DUF6499)